MERCRGKCTHSLYGPTIYRRFRLLLNKFNSLMYSYLLIVRKLPKLSLFIISTSAVVCACASRVLSSMPQLAAFDRIDHPSSRLQRWCTCKVLIYDWSVCRVLGLNFLAVGAFTHLPVHYNIGALDLLGAGTISMYRWYFQHMGKRGEYYLVHGDLPRQHSFGTTLRFTGPVPADSRQ